MKFYYICDEYVQFVHITYYYTIFLLHCVDRSMEYTYIVNIIIAVVHLCNLPVVLLVLKLMMKFGDAYCAIYICMCAGKST